MATCSKSGAMPSRRRFLGKAASAVGLIGVGSCLGAVGVAEEAFVRRKAIDGSFEDVDGERASAALLRAFSDGVSTIEAVVAEEFEAVLADPSVRVGEDLGGRVEEAFDEVSYRNTLCWRANGQRCREREERRAAFDRFGFGDAVVVDPGGVGRGFRIHEVHEGGLGDPADWELSTSTFNFADRYGGRGAPIEWAEGGSTGDSAR